MKIGLAYDLKPAARPGVADDAAEELDSPETIDALSAQIKRLGHQVVPLGGGPEFLDNLRRDTVDFVFNIAEGRGTYRSREAQVPGVLEMLGIPYSGSDPLTLSLCLDKPLAKGMVQSAGVATPAYYLVRGPDDLGGLANCGLGLPVVVKPAAEGSSKGIHATSRVDRWDQVPPAVEAIIAKYRQPALVEQFIPGWEVTVGIVGNNPPRLVGMMEVVPRNGTGRDFMYTLEVKRDWQRQVSYRCPPKLPPPWLVRLRRNALQAYQTLEIRDLARIDFRVDPEGRPFFLEANPLPGLSPLYSDLPVMAGLVGWSYSQLIESILNAALQRCGLSALAPANANLTFV